MSKLTLALVNNKLLSTDGNEQIYNSTANNLLFHESDENRIDILLIMYQSKNHAVFLNDWNNSAFFTAAFLILFQFGPGGHFCCTRKTALSIEMQAK